MGCVKLHSSARRKHAPGHVFTWAVFRIAVGQKETQVVVRESMGRVSLHAWAMIIEFQNTARGVGHAQTMFFLAIGFFLGFLHPNLIQMHPNLIQSHN